MTETLQNMTDLLHQPLHPRTKTRRLLFQLLAVGLIISSLASPSCGQQVPSIEPEPRPDLSSDEVQAVYLAKKLHLKIQAGAIAKREVRIPRLAATIRRWDWQEGQGDELTFSPEPNEWIFRWTQPVADGAIIELELESPPLTMTQLPPISPTADGSVMLPADQAYTHGKNLRFEPQPFKNTVGYWTDANDHVIWKLQVDQPGEYSVAILQGCGAGQGGSDAKIELIREEVVEAELQFSVEETGHFQNFRWRTLGNIHLSAPGDYELKLSALRIANAALLDVRAIHLVRQAKPE